MTLIEDFINKLTLADKTKKNYENCLKKFEKDNGKTLEELLEKPEELYNYIDCLEISKKTKQDKKFIISKLINTMELPITYFKEQLKSQVKVKKPQQVVEHTLNDIKNIYDDIKDKIESKNHILLLSLLINYPVVLRTDLCNVKLKDFKADEPHLEGRKIIFPVGSCMKIKNKTVLEIELSDEDISLANHGNVYLIDILTKDRSNGYSSLLKRITKKYLGKNMNQNSFRHLHSTFNLNDIDADFVEKYRKLKQAAQNQNHNLETLLEYYVDKLI